MIYLVYGKKKTEKRFAPFNMKDNTFVFNLIHASIFIEDQKDELVTEIAAMNRLNPDYIFEIRKQKN